MITAGETILYQEAGEKLPNWKLLLIWAVFSPFGVSGLIYAIRWRSGNFYRICILQITAAWRFCHLWSQDNG
ncbi:hypothetical protein DU191_23185 [Salmonella enterica subsp. enterica serovar Sandiego]|nr:hypothetical protein [Salmonella enterica subsp. enterica serovar Sandiego]